MAASIIKQKGLSIVEIVLAISIFAILSIGVFYLSLDTIQRDSKIELDNQALFYAQEGLEAVRNMRDRNFLSLTNGDHGLDFQNDTWTFITAPESVDNFFSRTITIDDVYRDSSGNIADSGTYDPDTKEITSEVSWNLRQVIPRSVELKMYIANWTGNNWIQSTCSEFNQGTFSSTATFTASSPPTDNCDIQLQDIANPSQFFSSANLGKHGNDVVIEGSYAYMATGNSSKGFAIVNISNPSSPTLTKDLSVWVKGNKLTKSGNKVYLGLDSYILSIAIINVANVSNPYVTYAWTLLGKGNQPFVNGNYLYMTANTPLPAFTVFNVSGIPYMTDYINLNSSANTVTVNGSYAYVGAADDNAGLRVIDISNPVNINQVASLDVGEEVNAIKISGVTAFVGTEDSSSSLKVLNISNPLAPTLVTSVDVGGEIQDLVISGDYLYAAVDNQNAGLAAINISNPLSPVLAYNLDIQGKGTGIDADANYIYITTDTNNKGLVIVGTTQIGVTTSGTYISGSYDTGSTDTRYNFIEWDHTEVPGGTVKFQLRTADTAANLNTAAWVGNNGTNSSYYTTSRSPIMLDPNRTGVRYFQFKAFIDSDGANSPSIQSVKIDFSP